MDNKNEIRKTFLSLPNRFIVAPGWISIKDDGPSSIRVLFSPDLFDYSSDVLIKMDDLFKTGMVAGGMVAGGRGSKEEEPTVQFVSGDNPDPSSVQVYDLVAIKREYVEPEDGPAIDEIEKAVPMKPTKFYKEWKEYFKGDEDKLWKEWGKKFIKGKIMIQPKVDGIRLHLHKKNGKIGAYTEVGEDRSQVLAGLDRALEPFGEVILDVEAIEYDKNNKPVSRWEMSWILNEKGPAKKNPGNVVYWVHDMLWLDGKDVTSLPYIERLKSVNSILSKSGKIESIKLMPTKVADSEEALKKGIEWAEGQKQMASEGAVLKSSQFSYGEGVSLAEVCKIKSLGEVNYAVIGYRKIPRSKPNNVQWTRKQAMKGLPKLLEQSNTYILHLALKSGNKLVPIESDQKIVKEDLHLDWDEEKQEWVGLHDNRLWTFYGEWEPRTVGDYDYGQSYAVLIEDSSLLKGGGGNLPVVVGIKPGKIRPFKGEDGQWHLSHQHPRDPVLKPRGTEVSDIHDVLVKFKLNPSDYKGLVHHE